MIREGYVSQMCKVRITSFRVTRREAETRLRIPGARLSFH
jgi:hypothetical protein